MTTYEYLNLLASYGGLGLLYYGIRVMAKGAEMRAIDSDRKHTETMTESDRRHTDSMAESRRREEESLRRHDEAMAESRPGKRKGSADTKNSWPNPGAGRRKGSAGTRSRWRPCVNSSSEPDSKFLFTANQREQCRDGS